MIGVAEIEKVVRGWGQRDGQLRAMASLAILYLTSLISIEPSHHTHAEIHTFFCTERLVRFNGPA